MERERLGPAVQERLAKRLARLAAKLPEKLTGSWVFWVAFIGILFALPLGRSLARTLPPAPPVLGSIRPFELTDQNGNRVGSEQLRDQLWVVAFLPPEGTPENTKAVDTVRHVIHRTKNLGSLFHMVTLPTDPAHTNVADRKALVEKYCSSSHLWMYLGGSAEELEHAEGKLFASLGAGPTDSLTLVDTRGRIRGVYGTDPSSLDRLMQDTGYVANLP
jgi:cytochrome oxidase Cu insertion factor (SCO1/SenC/PrrC family)